MSRIAQTPVDGKLRSRALQALLYERRVFKGLNLEKLSGLTGFNKPEYYFVPDKLTQKRICMNRGAGRVQQISKKSERGFTWLFNEIC